MLRIKERPERFTAVRPFFAFVMKGVSKAGILERLLLFLGRREAVRVSGSSMEPALTDGDLVIIDTAGEPECGDVVVAEHPYKSGVQIVKRVVQINAEGRFELAGDNPAESTDSRTFGMIARVDVRGRVISRIPGG